MSCEQLSKDVTYDNYDNIKSHKKPEFHPFSTVEGTFLEKALTPPSPPPAFYVFMSFFCHFCECVYCIVCFGRECLLLLLDLYSCQIVPLLYGCYEKVF